MECSMVTRTDSGSNKVRSKAHTSVSFFSGPSCDSFSFAPIVQVGTGVHGSFAFK